eukprot:scaffold690_cov327-Pavlova_lutheri.AAC.18
MNRGGSDAVRRATRRTHLPLLPFLRAFVRFHRLRACVRSMDRWMDGSFAAREGPCAPSCNGFAVVSQSLNPEWYATTPDRTFSHSTRANPARSTMRRSTSCLGKRRMLSTRYWYASPSPAIARPISGMIWNEYKSYMRANRGSWTWLNSKHKNLPPRRSTRWASTRARSLWVTFRSPKAMVYASMLSSSNGRSSASPTTNLRLDASPPCCLARSWPTSSMSGLMSHAVTVPLRFGPVPDLRSWDATLRITRMATSPVPPATSR